MGTRQKKVRLVDCIQRVSSHYDESQCYLFARFPMSVAHHILEVLNK